MGLRLPQVDLREIVEHRRAVQQASSSFPSMIGGESVAGDRDAEAPGLRSGFLRHSLRQGTT